MTATDWWATGTQLAVALATLVLAGFTALMASRTRDVAEETKGATAAAIRTAKATEEDVQHGLRLVEVGQEQTLASQAQSVAASEQAEVARRSLEATFRPLLVPVVDRLSREQFPLRGLNGVSLMAQLTAEPRGFLGLDDRATQRFFAIVPVRNVGPGPATFEQNLTDITFTPNYPGATKLHGRPSSPVVASGDVVDLVFYGPVDDFTSTIATGPEASHVATVVISYSDISQRESHCHPIGVRKGRWSNTPSNRSVDRTVATPPPAAAPASCVNPVPAVGEQSAGSQRDASCMEQ